jgi:glycosyltransferase involved in cell wall biosynthesis
MSKIGVAIITCDRTDYLNRLLESINKEESEIDELIIVNDGKKIDIKEYEIYNTSGRIGVGKAKNIAFDNLLKKDCKYIFLLEDDIIIKNSNVFKKYIETSKLSGIQHFNFAFHGRDNYNSVGQPAIRLRVEYDKDTAVCFYPNVYGAFSFYTKECLDKVGLMDPVYYNAMEHVDHTFFIAEAGMTTPFRWFADIAESNDYIEEIDRNHFGSEIRKDEQWISNFRKAVARFAEKTKINVTGPTDIFWTKEQAIAIVKQIKSRYGSK